MSEDVKPRKFTLERYGHTYYGNKVTKAHYNSYLYVDETLCENGLPKRETIYVIELEPTMRLIKDMAVALEHYEACHYDLQGYPCSHDKTATEVLEKYKKFQERIRQ